MKKSKKTFTEPTVMRDTDNNYDPNNHNIPSSVKKYIQKCRNPVGTIKKKKKVNTGLVK